LWGASRKHTTYLIYPDLTPFMALSFIPPNPKDVKPMALRSRMEKF
jgi:hypothetical protein